jgi:glycosyltransferase involved in cell wall biosynthesis
MKAPRASVILPAWESWPTIGGALRALDAQTCRDFETIVVDSSPDGRTAGVVRRFPRVRLVRSAERLGPHPARNLGVTHARGELLAFTDPDVYAHPDWLGRLIAEAEAGADAVVGAVGCHGARWFDEGVHLLKYGYWLPGDAPRVSPGVQSANVLCRRKVWEAFGGFAAAWTGDTAFGWWLEETGRTLRFAADAVVEHHHMTSPVAFVRERYERAHDFARVRARRLRWGAGRVLAHALATASGVRLLRHLATHARAAARSRRLLRFVTCLPVFGAGLVAWQIGEVVGLLEAVAPRPSAATATGRRPAR